MAYDSVLNFLPRILLYVNDAKVYTDLPGYNSSSIITRDEYCPDILHLTPETTLSMCAELTVGHESNLENNNICKKQKYASLVKELNHYKSVTYVNESKSPLTIFDKIGFDKKQQDFCV